MANMTSSSSRAWRWGARAIRSADGHQGWCAHIGRDRRWRRRGERGNAPAVTAASRRRGDAAGGARSPIVSTRPGPGRKPTAISSWRIGTELTGANPALFNGRVLMRRRQTLAERPPVARLCRDRLRELHRLPRLRLPGPFERQRLRPGGAAGRATAPSSSAAWATTRQTPARSTSRPARPIPTTSSPTAPSIWPARCCASSRRRPASAATRSRRTDRWIATFAGARTALMREVRAPLARRRDPRPRPPLPRARDPPGAVGHLPRPDGCRHRRRGDAAVHAGLSQVRAGLAAGRCRSAGRAAWHSRV